MVEIPLEDVVIEDIPTFDEWMEAQDFDYHRTESEVVDYINDTVDYDTLEHKITEEDNPEVVGLDEYLNEAGIGGESEKLAAENHINTYVNRRS